MFILSERLWRPLSYLLLNVRINDCAQNRSDPQLQLLFQWILVIQQQQLQLFLQRVHHGYNWNNNNHNNFRSFSKDIGFKSKETQSLDW